MSNHDQVSEDFTLSDFYVEKALCVALIQYHDKLWQDNPAETIGYHIIHSIEEFEEHIDTELFKKIIHLFKLNIKNKTPMTIAMLTQHQEQDIAQFSIDALTSPYHYADWERKDIYLQTQKKPEENYIRDTEYTIARFQVKKAKRIIQQLEDYFKKIDVSPHEEEFLINMKLYQLLIQKRNEIAAKLGMVTIN